jgi:glycine/D-amino acid oxidase-like deaminating enzyme
MARVVVIGAGVVGCSIALELARRRAEVTVVEAASNPFLGTSKAGFGSLTPYSDPFFVGEARKFAKLGTDLYRQEWVPRASAALGEEIAFGDDGLIQLCESDDDLGETLGIYGDLMEEGAARPLDVAEIADLEPEIALEGMAGGVWLDEPWVDLSQYLLGLQALLEQGEVTVLYDAPIAALEREDDGAIACRVEGGSVIHADRVVLATGLSRRRIDGLPTIDLRWMRGDAVGITEPSGRRLLTRHIYMHDAFITPRGDGRLLLGSTYVHEDGGPSEHDLMHRDRVNVDQVRKLLDWNIRLCPAITSCEVGDVWRGWRPTPVDRMPLVGPLSHDDRVFLATGFIGLGITMAPAVARSAADLLLDGRVTSPSTFAPSRLGL